MNINVNKFVKGYMIVILIMVILIGILGIFNIAYSVKAADAEMENFDSGYGYNDYKAIELNFVLDIEDKYKIYNPDELTDDVLLNRTQNDTLIIERVIGKCTDKVTGDGKILNTDDNYYNYISYRNCGLSIEDGTVLVTYLLYNPENDYEDDIVDRWDFILDREYED